MLNTAQIEARKNGLGGSDMATVIGVCPYKTEHQLYLEKTGLIEPKDLSDRESVVWGNLLEDAIARRYAEITGKEVYAIDEPVIHPDYPYFVANPDRLIKGEKRGLEIKNVGVRMSGLWGPSGSTEIPEYYVPQVMHYLFVMDYDFWDLAVLIGGQELRIYHFERDREFDDIIIDLGTKFWKNHVEKRIPPAADWNHTSGKELVKRLFPDVSDEEIALPNEFVRWRDVWLEAKEQVKAYQQVVDGAQAHLLSGMKGAGVAKLPDGSSFTRKLVKTKGYMVPDSQYVDFRFKKAGTK